MAATGAWVAHATPVTAEADVAVFSSEVLALRHAVRRGWHVTQVPYGRTLAEAIAEQGES
jgi:hypothetical protein